ncbi:2-polyprenyl-3-methyl-5-hydroxy-6-metoxy-1,4-benzoquinol methylase [Humidesulfovibrio mexicanus]|jgi:SAM-dependent methyltransferase|uniref:2-polyprenyl-3-methyl-5-hydroxy-6-metoxy-1,4-benzoquinol methylase n=1 Tax=Humidesulfovibrio mexicanus TaxID=147047 RepID=A0A239CMJ3_9BACT|nr:class I SAM-dependent methyltransferase [Humidesulfovibrio mexicanus]SNS21385.1 2-polyprenyl-3-methyl-5-hydroxy-6-metoxy-1,4-benzoquinol methylase [Humidesulfovibrio mexicanus]
MSDAFAARASEWDANPVRAAMHRAFYELVLRTAEENGGLDGRSVLEFGCGTGALGLRLAGHGARLTFVDTSPAMLEVLRGKLELEGAPRATVLEGDIARLSVGTASQDLAVTLMALHHVPDIVPMLARLRSLLRPGGLLLAGDLFTEDGSFHADGSAAHNGFDPEAMRAMCGEAGFAVRRLLPFHVLRRPDATGTMREYPLFFLAASPA